MNFQEASAYLNSLKNSEFFLGSASPQDFSLDKIKTLLSQLGNPQEDLIFVHVAGSKGKGSVCAMLSNIVKEAGYKVGLYTSPHFYDFRERVRLLTKDNLRTKEEDLFYGQIPEEDLCRFVDLIKPYIGLLKGISFFEALTVIALLFFRSQKVDLVVWETGLGGRLDATNIVKAKISVLMPISFEHTHILGNSLAAIAREKAAIIKGSEQKVIIASQEEKAMDIIQARCKEMNIDFLQVNKNVLCSQDIISLKGGHQRDNASVVVEIISVLRKQGFSISEKALRRGLSSTFWPGRFERIDKKRLYILDCAHNKASAEVLAKTFYSEYPYQKVILIFGVSDDKKREDICRELDPWVESVIFAKAKHPRAVSIKEDEGAVLFPGKKCFYRETVIEAIHLAEEISTQKEIILIAGSIFLVAEARKLLIPGAMSEE